ncbi:nucleotide-binding protein [uncultured Chitinophaga sp.]|uniref:nucleotide-binding protein n=1 Tax=uncultured Chitinophaga sp. TaxID=339340 RepID=UPI0025E5D256|nr:nucleotide-binding protein [uncultured Chitinophaga sp.]
MQKPRIFIGSSVESLPIADAINENLDHSAEVAIWRNGIFHLSDNTLDALIEKAKTFDYAIFIFSPDDIATIRNVEQKVARDNVVFELGLFIGTLGKERCFVVKPRNTDLHLPTDLLGLTTADYDTNRSDGDLASALNYACSLIKKAMGRRGVPPLPPGRPFPL